MCLPLNLHYVYRFFIIPRCRKGEHIGSPLQKHHYIARLLNPPWKIKPNHSRDYNVPVLPQPTEL